MKLVAFTNITIKSEDGDINVSIEAEESSLLPGGSTIVKVFVDPLKYLPKLGITASEGNFTGGTIETGGVRDEIVVLTKTSEQDFAKGSLKYYPVSTPTYDVLASIGGKCDVVFSGTDIQATSEIPYALVMKCSYSYQWKQYKYTAPQQPLASVAVLMGFLNA